MNCETGRHVFRMPEVQLVRDSRAIHCDCGGTVIHLAYDYRSMAYDLVLTDPDEVSDRDELVMMADYLLSELIEVQ